MKKLSTLFTILLSVICNAQTYRFFYDLTIRKPVDTVVISMVLDINRNTTKFYDENFLTIDSLNALKQSTLQAKSESDQLLIRKTNDSENHQYYTHTYDYFVVKSNDKISWKLDNEIKKLKNITLQKATANFGGRAWIAWFDANIPFQEGPYKFNGLPGLIYEVYDTQNIFHYSLVKNKNLPKTYDTTRFLETHYGKKPINVSLKQYHKVKLDYYHNIVEVLNEFSKKGGTIASDEELNSPEDIDRKRKILQQSIKKYYLPIEVDKAIPYL